MNALTFRCCCDRKTENYKKGKNKMSMLSSWVRKQVKKKGAKALIIKILDMVVAATPSKKDDEMVAKVKEVLAELED
jgi:hypothetical protein